MLSMVFTTDYSQLHLTIDKQNPSLTKLSTCLPNQYEKWNNIPRYTQTEINGWTGLFHLQNTQSILQKLKSKITSELMEGLTLENHAITGKNRCTTNWEPTAFSTQPLQKETISLVFSFVFYKLKSGISQYHVVCLAFMHHCRSSTTSVADYYIYTEPI